jgi:hypothetical protein
MGTCSSWCSSGGGGIAHRVLLCTCICSCSGCGILGSAIVVGALVTVYIGCSSRAV